MISNKCFLWMDTILPHVRCEVSSVLLIPQVPIPGCGSLWSGLGASVALVCTEVHTAHRADRTRHQDPAEHLLQGHGAHQGVSEGLASPQENRKQRLPNALFLIAFLPFTLWHVHFLITGVTIARRWSDGFKTPRQSGSAWRSTEGRRA